MFKAHVYISLPLPVFYPFFCKIICIFFSPSVKKFSLCVLRMLALFLSYKLQILSLCHLHFYFAYDDFVMNSQFVNSLSHLEFLVTVKNISLNLD